MEILLIMVQHGLIENTGQIRDHPDSSARIKDPYFPPDDLFVTAIEDAQIDWLDH
jgi:hypothetical protein